MILGTCKQHVYDTQCYEDKSLLRSTDQYFIDVERNDLSSTGIKEKYVWLDINDFSLFDQIGIDVMHDMLEGCCKYVMSFILVYYIKELKIFSLEVLNNRISCFDFGSESNKPCTLSMEHISVGKVRQSASEMLILIRYFALLIGDFVPLGDLYLTMRKVIDIMLSTSLEESNCTLLETLIGEMNNLYLKYSKNNLKPKFHFLVHYPSMIRKYGPVVHLWSMWFEAKHRVSKISARSSSNRGNICLTLAIKHQLQLNKLFNYGKLCSTVNIGPTKFIDPSKLNQIQVELSLRTEKP